MRINVVLLVSITFLPSCSTIFTNASEVEEGVYRVTAHGNAFNSREAMLAKALKKAEKKCGHADFVQVGDAATGNNKVYNTTVGGYTNSPNITITVDCNAEQ